MQSNAGEQSIASGVRMPVRFSIETWVTLNTLLVAAIALVVLTRGLTLWSGVSIWLDEAMLALNLKNQSFFELASPLPLYGQSAPLGYLLSSKVFAWALDYSQASFRVASVVANIVFAVAAFRLLDRLAGRPAAIVGFIFASLSLTMLHYSIEVKHYMAEVAATAVMMSLALNAVRDELSSRSLVMIWLGFSGCLMFSNGAPFVYGALGGAVLLHRWADIMARGRLASLIVCTAACVGVALIYYVLFLSASLENNLTTFDRFYDGAFLGNPFASFENAAMWLLLPVHWAKMVVGARIVTLGYTVVPAIAVLMIIAVGLVRAWRSQAWLVTTFGLLTVCVHVLSVIHFLPFNAYRYFLFTYPFVLVFTTLGIITIAETAAPPLATILKRPVQPRQTVMAAIALILLGLTPLLLLKSVKPEREALMPLLEEIAAHEARGEVRPIWVYFWTRPSVELLDFPLEGKFLGWGTEGIRVGEGPGVFFSSTAGPFDEQFAAYQDSYVAETRDLDSYWMVLTHFQFARERDHIDVLTRLAQDNGATCRTQTSAHIALLFLCERAG